MHNNLFSNYDNFSGDFPLTSIKILRINGTIAQLMFFPIGIPHMLEDETLLDAHINTYVVVAGKCFILRLLNRVYTA